MRSSMIALTAGLLAAGSVAAQELSVDMHEISTDGVGASIGTVRITSTDQGARFDGQLTGLSSGEHGFHIHENGDCAPGPNDQGQTVAGGAAGGHWDPENTDRHRGPEGDGHLGDLPAVVVDSGGTANIAAMAPRLNDLAAIQGKALMLHGEGDNYSDEPKPDGGGGPRVACGVIR
jgi:Cu-Zn family superoxide dismutase